MTQVRGAAGAPQPLLRIEGLHKSFGALEVLKGIDVSVEAGEVICIIGPSGSGKSTLLRCINLIERPDAGRVRLNDELIGYHDDGRRFVELSSAQVAVQRRQMGMVFQHFHLFPHLTVLENVIEAPIRVARQSRGEAIAAARGLLERVQLVDKADQYPRQLSGGQQQRVAIARALAMRPQLMLFDEPTSALDPETVGEVLSVMRSLADDGMTMIAVTHEIGFARDVADRILFMDGGVVVEAGPPAAVLADPQHERTRRFLARIVEAGQRV